MYDLWSNVMEREKERIEYETLWREGGAGDIKRFFS